MGALADPRAGPRRPRDVRVRRRARRHGPSRVRVVRLTDGPRFAARTGRGVLFALARGASSAASATFTVDADQDALAAYASAESTTGTWIRDAVLIPPDPPSGDAEEFSAGALELAGAMAAMSRVAVSGAAGRGRRVRVAARGRPGRGRGNLGGAVAAAGPRRAERH